MNCADLCRVRMGCSGIIDTFKKYYGGLFDSTLIPVEDKSMFTGDSHEFVETFVLFLVILSMNNYIICDAHHSIAVGEDWSIICWILSCAEARPQGMQTNLYLSHGVLKVVSSDDS